MKKYGYLTTKIGLIEIIVVAEQVVKVSFVNTRQVAKDSSNIVVVNCLKQLAMYFDKKLSDFNLPIALKGTPFQELAQKIVEWQHFLGLFFGRHLFLIFDRS
ncbi:hypothetical protein [Spiroplasma endosymbiont of Dactylopius coccus]